MTLFSLTVSSSISKSSLIKFSISIVDHKFFWVSITICWWFLFFVIVEISIILLIFYKITKILIVFKLSLSPISLLFICKYIIINLLNKHRNISSNISFKFSFIIFFKGIIIVLHFDKYRNRRKDFDDWF